VSDGAALGAGGGGLGDFVFGLVVIVTIVLSVAFVWPLIVLLFELVVASIVFGIRFAMGRWTVVAETRGERHSWRVQSRRRATAPVAEVAAALRAGRLLPASANAEATSSVGLTEAEIAQRHPSGHVRLIKR
jgi:hypothetical protein